MNRGRRGNFAKKKERQSEVRSKVKEAALKTGVIEVELVKAVGGKKKLGQGKVHVQTILNSQALLLPAVSREENRGRLKSQFQTGKVVTRGVSKRTQLRICIDYWNRSGTPTRAHNGDGEVGERIFGCIRTSLKQGEETVFLVCSQRDRSKSANLQT